MTDRPAVLGGQPAFDQPIPFVRPVLPTYDVLEKGLREMLASGMLTKGSHLRRFEEAVARYLGVKHAIGVSSCTAGLMLAYQGLGLSGEVVVPSFTFMATVSALVWNGLTPAFADVDFDTTNLDVAAAEAAITPQTTAIVAVHNFGNPAEVDQLVALARRRGLKLVFDAAHGFGTLHNGRPVGAQGDAQVFSLSPTKLLVAGEGGIVATNDDSLAEHIRLGREYGNDGTYNSAFAGLNARMPEMCALLGHQGLSLLDDVAQGRNRLADLFRDVLSDVPGIRFQLIRDGNRSSYKDFSVTIDAEKFGIDRDTLAAALAAENIDTRKYHHPPVHRHTAYSDFAKPGLRLPQTDRLAAESLSLPMGAQIDEAKVRRIGATIHRLHLAADEVGKALTARPATVLAK